MQFLRKENGSTLLLVIITVAVLTALGTTVLSLNYLNYNMKYTDQRMKETLYYSESGLDQVYSRLARYVDLAIVDAAKKTNDDIEYNENEKNLIQAAIKDITEAVNTDDSIKGAFYDYYVDNVYDISQASINMSESEFVARKLYLHIILNLYNKDDTNPDPTAKSLVESVITDTDKLNALHAFTMADGDDFLQFQSLNSGVMVKISNSTEILHKEYDVVTDTGEIDIFADEQMKFYFKNYFKVNETALITDVFGTLSTPQTFEYLNGDVTDTNSDFTISIPTTIDNFDGTRPDELVFYNVESSFVYNGEIKKSIATDIVIELPSLFKKLATAELKYTRSDNPLWRYALITHNDIDFNNANTTIDGSIYALGNKPADLDFALTRDPVNYDGISVRGDNTTTSINGDVVTQSYVQIFKDSNNSTLNINNGHVYCDSFMIQDGSTGGHINVNNGNVYTQDDLELNGEDSHINIDGSYYGFIGTAKIFNKTSAIVINANLSDTTKPRSSLTITGNSADVYAKEPYSGILIAGLSFINDDFNPDPYGGNGITTTDLYQTAESMGIKRNYLAYFFPSSEVNEEQTNSANGLYMYYQNPAGNLLSTEEKIAHFEEVSASGVVTLDTGNGNIVIDNNDYLYTEGLVVGSGNFDSHRIDPTKYIDEYAEKEIVRDYLYILHNLRNREIGQDGLTLFDTSVANNVIELIDRAGTAKVIDTFSKLNDASDSTTSVFDLDPDEDIIPDMLGPEDYNGSNIIGKQVKIAKVGYSSIEVTPRDDEFDHAVNFLLLGSNYGTLTDDNGNAVNTEKVYTINGVDYFVIMADPSTNVIHGIIATTGKVQMLGTLNFYGSIIAYDDIILGPDTVVNAVGGTHNITIVNNDISVQNYLTELINGSTKFQTDFNDKENYAGADNIDIPTITYIEDVIIAAGNTDALRQHFSEFIFYENWRLIQ